jgi:CRISPR-associated protein Csb2
MLTVDVEYLMGRVVASSYHDRQKVEFPPHPSRLFSSLVAAYEECVLGEDARKALEWLETLPDPSLYANPPFVTNHGRDVLTNYVPVNDEAYYPASGGDKNKPRITSQPPISNGQVLNRLRAERVFPALTLDDPHVKFMWNTGNEARIYIPALRSIAGHVTYLGHSMTPVAIRVDDSTTTPNIIPDPDGDIMMRTIGMGRLRHLEETYELRRKNPAIQPKIGKITAYSVTSAIPRTIEVKNKFGDYITFRLDNSQSIPLASVYMILSAARNAFLSLYPEPLPEVISGHLGDGKPSGKHHLAVIAHPDVGHHYADGHIMGLSFLFPSGIDDQVRKSAEYAASKLKEITLGKLGVIGVNRIYADMMPNIPGGLRMSTFRRPNAVWATTTPALFGKHPHKSAVGAGKDGGAVFQEACEMVGLPKPVEVNMGPSSAFEGSPLARDFMVPKKFREYLKTHLLIRFAEPVRGPVILGSGRFAGFGVCKPYSGKD